MIDFLARAACAIACVGAAQAATITVTPLSNSDTSVVTVEGEFVLEDIQAFRQRVVSQPKAIIAFQSDGGSVIAGIEIGKIIRLRNFATLVPDNSRCASACALAWLGGAVRFMGPEAQIGFHAAYVVRSGQASETGSGNALVGAYLANIGLPDSAVVYVTQASPTAMTWLNMAEAQQKGIDVALFTPPSNDNPPRPNLQPTNTRSTDLDSMRRKATDFVTSLLAHWSDANTPFALRLFDSVYATQVSYYGAIKDKQEVLEDKRKFSERWPQRNYRVRDGSLNARCDVPAAACNVSGIMDWVVESPNRGAKSNGSANFSYGLTFEGQTALIVKEDSSVIERRTEYMSSPGSRESIRRSVLKFHEIYQQSGMAGLNGEIKDCWQKLKPLPAENEIAYCFGLDYISGYFDDAAAKEHGWPSNQYTTPANSARRVEIALARTKMARGDILNTTEAWANLARHTLDQP